MNATPQTWKATGHARPQYLLKATWPIRHCINPNQCIQLQSCYRPQMSLVVINALIYSNDWLHECTLHLSYYHLCTLCQSHHREWNAHFVGNHFFCGKPCSITIVYMKCSQFIYLQFLHVPHQDKLIVKGTFLLSWHCNGRHFSSMLTSIFHKDFLLQYAISTSWCRWSFHKWT